MEWLALSSALLIALLSNLANMERRHLDWFDDNAADIRFNILDKNAAHDAQIQSYANIKDTKNFHEALNGV